MSPTETFARSQQTGLSDSTQSSSSSSSSAERFRLDEEDTAPILLYKYRAGGLKRSSQKELCDILDKDGGLRVTRKDIPRYTSYIDVKRHDLYLPQEKKLYGNYPNYDSNLASIKVPSLAYWSRLLLGSYQELFIVSPETSPSSSQVDEDSRQTSPTNTWSNEGLDDAARLGASQESSQEL